MRCQSCQRPGVQAIHCRGCNRTVCGECCRCVPAEEIGRLADSPSELIEALTEQGNFHDTFRG